MTSGRYSERLLDVMHVWSMDDVCAAHDFIDFFEKAERKARERARREVEAARRT